MSSKKADKPDLNAPLRSLSDRLRFLQKEATQLLESVRTEVGRGESGRDVQKGRVAANFLERWDIATRADLDQIHRRLDAIEAAILSLHKPAESAETGRTAKTRRRKRPSSD